MAMKKRALILLIASALLLSGCRARVVSTGQPNPADAGAADEKRTGPAAMESAPADSQESEPSGDRTRENPEASRKEYDENAAAEIVDGTNRLLSDQGEGDGAGLSSPEAPESAAQVSAQAEETALQTLAVPEAEKTGVSPDAEAADSALTYYTVLLADRLGSLYECQRAYAYLETEQDHVTIHKTSPEHALLLEAGVYDVSARLLPENLQVDDGWVARKNPDVIVKVVESSVLGSGAVSSGAARAVYESLLSREGWKQISAVKNGKLLLLSRELLNSPWQRTAALLLIAKAANEDLFRDVDAGEALRALTQEATGALPTGVSYYTGKEE